MPESQRLRLTDVDATDSRRRGSLNRFKQRAFVARRELRFQLVGLVEMILDRPLVAPGNENHIGDACRGGLFDGILNQRLVYDRQHLFGTCLGRGQQSRAEAGNREHRLGNFTERHR